MRMTSAEKKKKKRKKKKTFFPVYTMQVTETLQSFSIFFS